MDRESPIKNDTRTEARYQQEKCLEEFAYIQASFSKTMTISKWKTALKTAEKEEEERQAKFGVVGLHTGGRHAKRVATDRLHSMA